MIRLNQLRLTDALLVVGLIPLAYWTDTDGKPPAVSVVSTVMQVTSMW